MVAFPTLVAFLLGLFKTCHAKQVFDFSGDNDRLPDNESAYTHASLRKGNLPRSFTICAAFMVEAWTEETYSYVFSLMSSKAYQIIVADAADAISVNFSGRCKFLQI